jgi:hypothetical protein
VRAHAPRRGARPRAAPALTPRSPRARARRIVSLLALLNERSAVNGQTPEALGDVFGPLLLRRTHADLSRATPRGHTAAAAAEQERSYAALMVRHFILERAYLFPDTASDVTTALFDGDAAGGLARGGATPGRRPSSGASTARGSSGGGPLASPRRSSAASWGAEAQLAGT